MRISWQMKFVRPTSQEGSSQVLRMLTVVAEILAELAHFEPEFCICNGNKLEFGGASVYL